MNKLIVLSVVFFSAFAFGTECEPIPPEVDQEISGILTKEEQIDYCVKKMYAYSLLDDREGFLFYMNLLKKVIGPD